MEEKEINVRLFFDRLITTIDSDESSSILGSDGRKPPKTRQRVIAAGPNSGVVPGEEVEINFDLFPRQKVKDALHGIGADTYAVSLPIKEIEGVPCFFISSRELLWVYNK